MEVLDARFIASAPDVRKLPAPAYAEIGFAGRSNVGKSSLINALLGRRKLVRTSGTPGCTRGLQLFRVRLRDAMLDFVDLPGYGYARRSKSERLAWGPMVEGFLRTRAGLRAVVVIIDVRRGLETDDEELIDFLDHLGIASVLVATKLDKLSASKRKPRLNELRDQAGGRRVYGFSATDRTGHEALWKRLLELAHVQAQ